MKKLKEKIAKALKIKDANSQLHVNMAVWINWLIMIVFLFSFMGFGIEKAVNFTTYFLYFVGAFLIGWEIVYWKGKIGDSIRDIVYAIAVLSPITATIITIKISLL